MIDFLTESTPFAIVLAVVACVAWAVCLVMAFMRWRAFRQQTDLRWTLAYLCLLGAGIGRVWTAYVWWSMHQFEESILALSVRTLDGVLPMNLILAVDLAISALFAIAAVLAIFANRRRPDAFD